MANIHTRTVEFQRQVVDKFNASKYPHYQIRSEISHGASMDYFMAVNVDQLHHDMILFLDIDCIPLCEEANDYFLAEAAKGKIVGNIQRSNHIQNSQHLFAAPSALALSVDTYRTIGKPSAVETSRGDVGEEYTFAAEEKGIPIELILPSRYENSPFECKCWPLKVGMPTYGLGTTFTHREIGDLFWHNFQITRPGQQDNFQRKCASILKEQFNPHRHPFYYFIPNPNGPISESPILVFDSERKFLID